MAATLQSQLDVTPELIKSGGGVFEVTADGQLIYSKKATGRFPEDAEVLEAIADQVKSK